MVVAGRSRAAVAGGLLSIILAPAGLLAAEASAPAKAATPATSAPPPAGVVSHVKVVSDKVRDVSSLESWKTSYLSDGLSDQDKALLVWETVVAFRHQASPPNEYLGSEAHPHDPIKDFNVYGYGQCCCASANVEALARYAGLPARGWGITAHSVPEIQVGGKWCMYDASLVNYFSTPDGARAGVEDVSKDITAFYAKHPELKNNNDKLLQFMRAGGWRKGPPVVASSPFYDDNGWLPAATHGWYSSMQEFGSEKKNFLYEYGSAAGYEVNIQLRPGERLTRNWSNKGLDVNGPDNPVLKAVVGKDDLRYSPKFGDLAPGRIGNGTLEYALPLASGAFRGGVLDADNLATSTEEPGGPAVHVKDAGKPAALAFRMPSPYVYLTGGLTFEAVVAAGGSVRVSFSDNNGLDWKDIANVTASGPQTVDLKPLVFRRYDYRLRFALSGKGTGLNAVMVTHDVQHSQRPLPALDKGTNQIRFSAGAQEGTITVEGSTNLEFKGKNLQFADFHPTLTDVSGVPLKLDKGEGDITIPVQTPGDLTRLRIGTHYRARDAKDGWDVQASFDGGKTFKPVGTLEGPYAGMSKYFVFPDVPPGTKSALVKLAGKQRNTLCLFDLRIDADYAEPHGAYSPVKVTYSWEENGQLKQDVHIARKAEEAYNIDCADKPVMKSITMELAE